MIYAKRNKHIDDEGIPKIIPEGSGLRVSLAAMDSTQRQIASQPALDQRVRDVVAANQANLAAAQRTADRVQGFADHFSHQRAAQVDRSNYGAYCRELSDAWQQVTA